MSQKYAITTVDNVLMVVWFTVSGSGCGFYRAAVPGYLATIPSDPRISANREAAMLEVACSGRKPTPEEIERFKPTDWTEVPIEEI